MLVIDPTARISKLADIEDSVRGSRIDIGSGLHVGAHVAVAANCTFAPVSHEYARRDRLIVEQGFRPSKGGIVIGDDVWIGANYVLLDGARVGKGCVIAAGSVVRGVLEDYHIYGGNPLRVLGQRQ